MSQKVQHPETEAGSENYNIAAYGKAGEGMRSVVTAVPSLWRWLLYAFRWLVWVFRYAVVWPAATLMILFALMYMSAEQTAGQLLAGEVMNATRGVAPGEYRVPLCAGSTGSPVRECHGSYVTGIEGYADYINDSLRGIPSLWLTMAVYCMGLGALPGNLPVVPHRAGPFSSLHRCRPATGSAGAGAGQAHREHHDE